MINRRRQVRAERGQWRRRPGELLPQQRKIICSPERGLAGEHLVGGACQRMEISLAAGRRPGLPAQPEVSEVDVIGIAVADRLVEQHVGRPDITVDQASGVRRIQRGRDLADDAACPRGVQRAEPPDQHPDVTPAHVAHGDEKDAAGLSRLEHRDDVRVVDGRRRPRLADEPPAE
jgi:hypothetical protein